MTTVSTAHNQNIYEAAYAGAYAGMSAGRYLTDTNPNVYLPTANEAVTWAKAVDQAVAATGMTITQLHANICKSESYGKWVGRYETDVLDYSAEAKGLAARLLAASTVYASTGADPNAPPVGLPTDLGLGAILVYRPGGTYTTSSPQPSNVFTDAPSLFAALKTVGSNAIVRVDSTAAPGGIAAFPANLGTIDLGEGVLFEPANTDFDTNTRSITAPADILQIGSGTSLTGFRGIRGALQLQALCTSGSAIIMEDGDAYTLTDGASLVLLSGSTSPLVQTAPYSVFDTSVSATYSLIADGQVTLASQAPGVPLFGLGYAATVANITVFSSRSVSLQGVVFGGTGGTGPTGTTGSGGVTGSVYYNFDPSGAPLLSGPNQPVAVNVTVVNTLQSQLPLDEIVFNPGATSSSSSAGTYGPVCSTWAEVMAWVNCSNNAVTDITVSIPNAGTSSGSYTLTATTAGQAYKLTGVTLHGAPAPNDGALVLADGVVLQDLAGITDGLDVEASAATTSPFTFSVPGASFFIDGEASLSFATGSAASVAYGSVPAISISGALSPFELTVTDGGSLDNATGTAALLQLADPASVVRLVATGGQAPSGAVLSGLVVSGPVGSQLDFEHDATVSLPSLTAFKGTLNDVRLSLAANVLASTGPFANAPSNGAVGDLYFATDLQALCVCLGSGKWVSSNVTTGLASAIPTAGVFGQLYFATDTKLLSLWNGSTWTPLGSETSPVIVFRPGAAYSPSNPQPANVFTDGASFVAALQAAGSNTTVQIDSSQAPGGIATLPGSLGLITLAGGIVFRPFNADDIAESMSSNTPADILQIGPGTSLVGFGGIQGPLRIQAQCTTGPAITMRDGDTIDLENGASLVLLSGSTCQLVQTAASTATSPSYTLNTHGLVMLQSNVPDLSVFVLGFSTLANITPTTLSVTSSGWLTLDGVIFGGIGTVDYQFDSTGVPLLAGPNLPVAAGTNVTNRLLSLDQRSSLLFDPTSPVQGAFPYGGLCSTWAEVMAWVHCLRNTVTDITFKLPSEGYTLTSADVPYDLAGITLHGEPTSGPLVLADGIVFQDVEGLTDGLEVQAVATTTVPFTFSAGATFSITDGASLSFVPNPVISTPTTATPTQSVVSSASVAEHRKHSRHHGPAPKHAKNAPRTGAQPVATSGTTTSAATGAAPTASAAQPTPPSNGAVSAISISGATSPFALSITNGGSLANTNGPAAIVGLADASSIVHVVATDGESPSTFSGFVFSGPSGSQLYFSHDATVLAPSLDSFSGQFFDVRLAMAASVLPSSGNAVSAPANGVQGDLYYASDLQTLCVCVGSGKWVSSNATVGTASEIPSSGIIGQMYFATDTNLLSVWNGSVWTPLGLTSGLGKDLPDTGVQGQMYLQSDRHTLSVWNNGQWMSAKLHPENRSA